VSSIGGRLDYIETIDSWNERIGTPNLRKTLLKLQLLPRWLANADFRLAFSSGVSANQVCFERELLDHYRLVFENIANADDRGVPRLRSADPPARDLSTVTASYGSAR
jgi:cyclopropane-fatty-acyl-phospholipid synthase